MANIYSFRDSNIRKTWFIFVVFLVIIIGLGWSFSYFYDDPAILYFAVVFSFLMNFLAYWKSDKIVLAMSRAKEADKNYFKEIYNIVENLSITAGLPTPKVYVIDTPAINAFATGRNPKNAVVALTMGIIEKLNRAEIEGVVAHEMSHIKNYDTLLSTVVVILVGFVAILSDIFLRTSHRRGGDDKGQNSIFAILGVVLIILAPIVGKLIRLAISRKREFLADASGVLLTRYPEGLAGALEKISKSQPMPFAQNATAHLFIANPFKIDAQEKKTPFLAKLFMTHPPIEERIKALKEMS